MEKCEQPNEYLVCLLGALVTLCHACWVIVKGFASPILGGDGLS